MTELCESCVEQDGLIRYDGTVLCDECEAERVKKQEKELPEKQAQIVELRAELDRLMLAQHREVDFYHKHAVGEDLIDSAKIQTNLESKLAATRRKHNNLVSEVYWILDRQAKALKSEQWGFEPEAEAVFKNTREVARKLGEKLLETEDVSLLVELADRLLGEGHTNVGDGLILVRDNW